jgi:hypothetical protein
MAYSQQGWRVATSSSGGGVQSVTGLNTDNTDPANPIVNISVDGSTITGDGTPANPLVAVADGVQSVTGLNTDNTDPANPIVNISVDGTSITGSGTPLIPLQANAYQTVQEETVSIPQRTVLNFQGSGVIASDDPINNRTNITIAGSSGNTIYYMNQTINEPPYKEFSSVPTLAIEQDVPTTISAGATSVIGAFQTPIGIPNTTNIPSGLWQFYIHLYSSVATDDWDIFVEVYSRDTLGTETLLFTSDIETVVDMSTTTTMYLLDGVFPLTSVLTTDRIVVKINATNTGSGSQTIHFLTEGSQHYSVSFTTLNQVIPSGAVTNVSGTSPIASTGGTTPAISISQSNTTTDGYLSSTDWNTFNNKQNALGFTPVPDTRNITVNGVTQNLTADRTYTVTDANLSTSDITTNDVSILKHGFAPKAPNDTSKFLRGDATWANLPASSAIARTLFVATTGDDATAVVGDIGKPYLTLEGAKTASTNGDLIYVFAGTYTVTTTATEGLAKDGVSYYFSPETTINKATTGDIFRANGFVYGFSVLGYGNFNKTTNTGSIFSTSNIVVYGSVSTFGSLVGGTGYTTGIKTTTGGSGINLTVNVTSVSGGVITALSISNVGSGYKVGDVITIVGGATPATITVTAIVTLPDTDADILFECNDIYCTVASSIFDIRSTARCTIRFKNAQSTATSMFYVDVSNLTMNMYSCVTSSGGVFGNSATSSNLQVEGYLIQTTSTSANVSAIYLSTATRALFNVAYILTSSSTGYGITCNGYSATATLNVVSTTGLHGNYGFYAGIDYYLNGYAGSISGQLNLYGGQVGLVSGIGSGLIDTTYYGVKSNGGSATITVSGGDVTLKMTNQDFTTGFAISGGLVTLNGTWTSDDMISASDLTGGTLILNGDYEYGGAYYAPVRFYGIKVNGGTLIVNGTIRINMPSTTALYSLYGSPIEYNAGKVIINGGTLISNVDVATPIRTTSAGLSLKVYSGGMNTNLVQNGGTLSAKKMKMKYNVTAVASTSITLNDGSGGNETFTESNTATYNTTALLAQRMVVLINASATLDITASQDSAGVDTYFYVEMDTAGLTFTVPAYTNLTETAICPAMYALTQSVLGTIIEDTDVE